MGKQILKFMTIMAVIVMIAMATGCSKQSSSNSSMQKSAVETSVPAATGGTGASEAGIEQPSTTTSVTAAKSAVFPKPDKVLLFDIANKEIFNPDNVKDLGYSKMRDIFRSHGYAVRINREPLTDKTLSDVDAVIIAGPMEPLSGPQVDALVKYVNSGGDLLITLHIADVAYTLAERFGLQLSNSVIAQTHDTFEGSPKNLIATGVVKDDITAGVSGVAVRKSWGVRAAKDGAKVVVSTAADAWADINPNDQYDQGEPVGAFGIVGTAVVGKGRVVVVGDDATFVNATLDMEGNRALCDNIVGWFGASKR